MPARLRLPAAISKSSVTHSSGACTPSFILNAAVTPSNEAPAAPQATAALIVISGPLATEVYPDLSRRIWNPNQVAGSFGAAPSGMSLTARAAGPQASAGANTTQRLCRTPLLSIASPFGLETNGCRSSPDFLSGRPNHSSRINIFPVARSVPQLRAHSRVAWWSCAPCRMATTLIPHPGQPFRRRIQADLRHRNIGR